MAMQWDGAEKMNIVSENVAQYNAVQCVIRTFILVTQ